MTINLIRMAVQIESVAHLQQVQSKRLLAATNKGQSRLFTFTRNIPRRTVELVNGGSIYWVIKRYIRIRQRILAIEKQTNREGRSHCAIEIDPEPIQVVPRRQKAFQGWRYLQMEDSPQDLIATDVDATDIPDELEKELRELGLL